MQMPQLLMLMPGLMLCSMLLHLLMHMLMQWLHLHHVHAAVRVTAVHVATARVTAMRAAAMVH